MRLNSENGLVDGSFYVRNSHFTAGGSVQSVQDAPYIDHGGGGLIQTLFCER